MPAALAILNRHPVDPRCIARITNEIFRTVTTHISSKEVGSVMAACVSMPYCIAISAVDRRLTQAQFALERVNDPLVRQVLERTEIVADADLDKLYPDKFPACVTVTLDNGGSFAETVPLPKGDPGTPLSDEALEDKFRGNCVGLLDLARTNRLQGAILGLPEAPTVEALLAGAR